MLEAAAEEEAELRVRDGLGGCGEDAGGKSVGVGVVGAGSVATVRRGRDRGWGGVGCW